MGFDYDAEEYERERRAEAAAIRDVVDLGGGWKLERTPWGHYATVVWAIVAPDGSAQKISDNAAAKVRGVVARLAAVEAERDELRVNNDALYERVTQLENDADHV